MPSTGGYLVSPRLIASIAACLTLSGVSKSGSPTESEMMSRPLALRSRAFCVTTMVAEGFTRERTSARKAMTKEAPLRVLGCALDPPRRIGAGASIVTPRSDRNLSLTRAVLGSGVRASIHRQARAGDVRGLGAGDERHERRNVVDAAVSLERGIRLL